MPRKGSDSKKPVKKAAGAPDKDDSSTDSKGNIRNLIDYDYDESEGEVFDMEETVDKPHGPRKAKLLAKKRLRKLADLASESSESTAPKKRVKPLLIVNDGAPKVNAPSKRGKKKAAPPPESESEEEEVAEPRKTLKRPVKKANMRVVEPESEEDTEEEEVVEPRKAPKRPVKKAKKRAVESESEEEYDSDDSASDDDSEEYSDDDDSDDDSDDSDSDSDGDNDFVRRHRRGGGGAIDIVISDILGGGGGRDPNKPTKYNMKKESADVRRFVELVQKEDEEEDTIDNDITYFKSLAADKQGALLTVLEIKASPSEVAVPIKFKILEKVAARPELNRIAMAKYNALCNIEPSSSEYYKVDHWIGGFTALPLGVFKDLPVKLEDGPEKCQEFMGTVHKCLDSAIYGHDEPKLQIMQFVSSWIANPAGHGNVLSIHGPMGVGKTTLIKDGVARALGRPFFFITLGGATDASFLDGHSYTYEGSTWGKIVDILIQAKCMNPIIYFDELDKVSETPKGDEIMNLLIHLTDGSQNDRFQDKYFTGIDLDLSRCLFIFSHNNHEKVNPILRDRMYNIAVKGFSIKDKLLIAENYLLSAALKESGLYEKVSISKEILQYVVENFTGGEAGVRELKRCIQTLVSKLNLLRFYNNPKQVPFAIEGFSLPFILKKAHVDIFLKRKEESDPSIRHMYM